MKAISRYAENILERFCGINCNLNVLQFHLLELNLFFGIYSKKQGQLLELTAQETAD